jgi:hypothetical protein
MTSPLEALHQQYDKKEQERLHDYIEHQNANIRDAMRQHRVLQMNNGPARQNAPRQTNTIIKHNKLGLECAFMK